MDQTKFDKVMYGITDDDLAGVTTLSGEPVTFDFLFPGGFCALNVATLKSMGEGRYFVKLGKDPLRPIYAYTGANTESPQKFVLDLRNRPLGVTARPPFSTANVME
jgi:hypothetical protein